MRTKSSLDQSLLQTTLCDDGRGDLIVGLNFLHSALLIHLKLWVFLGVMTEKKCFCWLDAAAEPATEVIVVDARFEALCIQFDQDLKESKVKVFLL